MIPRFLTLLLAAFMAAGVAAFVSTRSADGPGSQEAGESSYRREDVTFWSDALGREMTASVFLPPGYDGNDAGYPVLYMLHGFGGDRLEWIGYGLFDIAATMIEAGEIEPLIIVTPEGERSYWFNHAADGERWGDYLAMDVVGVVDTKYRTLQAAARRAVGGLSMGADGALQIAVNYPDVFAVVGAHSPVLRTYDQVEPYYGSRAYFETKYPVTLVKARLEVARLLSIQLDVGDVDPWLDHAVDFHEELLELGVQHSWSLGQGDHSAAYWRARLPQYLRWYSQALAARR